jgi:hypothetical protein
MIVFSTMFFLLQSMRWNRNNITATMEKYEPAQKHHQQFKNSSMRSSSKCHPQSQQYPNQDYLNEIHQDYAYAYYEPGVPMRHNIPSCYEEAGPSRPPPANSIRALLMTARKNNMQRNGGKIFYSGHDSGVSGSGTNVRNQENVYEEIRDDKLRKLKAEPSSVSLEQNLVEEEFREVHNRHQRTLGELNLSVEEMLMPSAEAEAELENPEPSTSFYQPSDLSSTHSKCELSPSKQQNDEFCIDLVSSPMVNYNRDFTPISGLDSSSSSCNNTSTSITSNNNVITSDLSGEGSNGGGDLDSGFSGSNSSYIGSLRYHKTMRSAAAMKMSPMNRSLYRTPELPPNTVSFPKHDHNPYCCSHNTPLQIRDDFGINSLSLYDSDRMRCCSGSPAIIGSCREPTIFMSQFSRSNGNFSPQISPPEKSSKSSFWKSKTWCKLPGFSKNSTNSKLESNSKLNFFFVFPNRDVCTILGTEISLLGYGR